MLHDKCRIKITINAKKESLNKKKLSKVAMRYIKTVSHRYNHHSNNQSKKLPPRSLVN
jgi:hypothetical protein